MTNINGNTLTPVQGNSFNGLQPKSMLNEIGGFVQGMGHIVGDFLATAFTPQAPEIANVTENSLDNDALPKPSFARGMRS